MPAMYPEQLRALREQNPGLQYDFRGNVVGATPPDSVQMAADAIYQLPGMQPNAWDFGPTRNDYLNSKDFVGPMPQQWWDPNGDLMQSGQGWLDGFMQGRDLQPRRASRSRNPYAPDRPASPGMQMVPPEVRNTQPRALHAGAADILADAAENNWGVNAFTFRPSYDYRYAGYGAPYPFDHDDGSGEYTPGM